jgi:prolyl-tRNA editing enzyme YbaK/EbsC (Cys-tRNA(Pro) deacylase)
MDSILEKAAVKRAQAALDMHGISGKIKILAESARTAAEAAAGLGIEVGQIASSLVFKLPDQRSLLVITSGRHRVDTQMVADLLQVPVLDRADADYVKEISGYSVGGVSPLGWMNEPSITLIDEALSDYQVIWAAAGHPHAVFPSTYQELLKASGAKAARVGN